MSFFRQGDVTDALIAVSAHVVVVRQVLLGRELLCSNVHVAVGHLVGREDVVIGDNNDLVTVPYLRVLAEVVFEDANCPWSTNVVRHEDVGV